ncbi:MAG: phospho-N-acetylmuramoyl-pentapeptide-transferase [Armatimonadota bacterium]|nr:phospho-N-acetylmuramoyl-pentapeptide-transferase [Armatimonadota bacterium]
MSAWAAAPLWAQMLVAAVAASGIVALAGPRTVALLAAWGQRQWIRDDAPKRHQEKAGTPTMGGLLIVAGIAVAALLVGGAHPVMVFGLACMVAFGGIGLIDDVLAIRRRRNLGLRARERLTAQMVAAIALSWYASAQPWAATQVVVPWMGSVDFGRAYAGLAALLLVGFSNAVNLTDGLDGLAAGLVAIAGVGFAVLAVAAGMRPVAILAIAVAGGAAGFLRVNAHPARLIMGDVGSNALGAGLAALAILAKAEVALFVIGGVFVAEAASVFLQVAYFKSTGGKRIFRMSPLHHHFELGGWAETTVVRRFYWAGAICLLAGLLVARP